MMNNTQAISPYNKDSTLNSLVRLSLNSHLALRITSIWNQFKHAIGGILRDTFFLPMFHKLSFKDEQQNQQEELYFSNFWDPTHPIYPELAHHKEIKKTFTKRIEQVPVLVDGQKLEVNYLVIESKDHQQKENQEFYTFIHVLGNLSTINNNIMSTYPFIGSYLKQKKENPNMPPARFILISQYNTTIQENSNTTYKPKTLNEAGLILAECIKELEKRYGKANQLVAHSIGCIAFTSSLKYFDAASSGIPRHIHLDRGPSSILKLSNRSFGGWLYFPLALLTGWTLDFGEEVANFCNKTRFTRQGNHTPSILVSSVQYDHIFPGDTSLYLSPQVQDLRNTKEVTILPFAPPLQWISNFRALHCASNAAFSSRHLPSKYQNQSFIKEDETLSDAVIRRSLPQNQVG